MDSNLKKNGPAVVFRADSGVRMGTGHVMRCMALAQAWRETGGKPVFAIAGDPLQRLKDENVHCVKVKVVPGSADDVTATVELAKQVNAFWVIVDGYHFGSDFQKELKKAGFRVVAVDDNGESKSYYADRVVNANLHAKKGMYPDRAEYTKLLLGPRYAFLRREFWDSFKKPREIAVKGKNLLITLGGSDPDNITETIITVLGLIKPHWNEAVVLVGAGNPHMDALEKAAHRISGLSLVKDARNMVHLMEWADAAISAGGSTCWELAATRLPMIMIVLAENQVDIAEAVQKACAGVNLGWGHKLDIEHAAQKVTDILNSQEARTKMSMAAVSITDGLGGMRTVGHMMEYSDRRT